MNLAFKIMAYSIMLNFAVGIMMVAIPGAFDGTLNPNRGGLSYNGTLTSAFTGQMENEVNPTGVLEDEGNAIYRVLDMLNLGFISQFLTAIKQYVFGFVLILDKMVGSYLTPALRTFLFGYPVGVFTVLTIFVYIMGAWSLWTGKDVSS